MGRLNWNRVRNLQYQKKKTKNGKKFHVEKVTKGAVIVRPNQGRRHRVNRKYLEEAVRRINQGVVLNGPGDSRREIGDDKPSYAWPIVRNLSYV